MSLTGQTRHHDVPVEEYGHCLGPPHGVLVLRYPRTDRATHFPPARDDLRHQVFWSPTGALAVRHGGAITHLGPTQAFWVRRGSALEVTTWGPQPVYVVCLRMAPAHLLDLSAATVELSPSGRGAVGHLCRPGVTEEEAMELKDDFLGALSRPAQLADGGHGTGLARRVAAAMMNDPADPTELAEWAQRLHTSLKTLQRDFLREYDMSWTHWRTSMRLQASTALLGQYAVTDVAHRVGWESPSAYVQAFRKHYGATPGAWVRSTPLG